MTAVPRQPLSGSRIHAIYPVIAPLIESALPRQNDTPITARQIFQAVRFGTIGTVRLVLAALVADGRAVRSSAAFRRSGVIHFYRRAEIAS